MGRVGSLLYRGETMKISNQKIKYMNNLELKKMELKNPKMFHKSINALKIMMREIRKSDSGDGKTFNSLMKNFDCFRWLLFNTNDLEFKKEIIEIIYESYKRDGNKFQSGFNEFFTYISKNKFIEIENGDVLLYRNMSSEEFEEIEYEGNQNLCWSTSISEIERFGLIKVLSKETKRSCLVLAIYNSDDIVYFNQNKSQNKENECWVKKGANPKYYTKLFGFEKTYIKRRTGLDTEKIDLDIKKSRNGFSWSDTILEDYGIKTKNCSATFESFVKVVGKRIEKFVNKFGIMEKEIIHFETI
jgi:hypothetical protein